MAEWIITAKQLEHIDKTDPARASLVRQGRDAGEGRWWVPEHVRFPGRKPVPAAVPARRDPSYPLEVLERARGRATICEGCDRCRRVTLPTAGSKWLAYVVSCNSCGCGGLNLITGDCPAGKW